ncbi:hypothetical protein COCON_G00169790 [Conger conger]|uniref:Uncharacterized protein n=1 Tax=Conger conger TaxID=82655 RepID=A0A9Q1D7N4_CONCO|nr:hypothetical protein COCON_G00169790 [Conger conger]
MLSHTINNLQRQLQSLESRLVINGSLQHSQMTQRNTPAYCHCPMNYGAHCICIKNLIIHFHATHLRRELTISGGKKSHYYKTIFEMMLLLREYVKC